MSLVLYKENTYEVNNQTKKAKNKFYFTNGKSSQVKFKMP